MPTRTRSRFTTANVVVIGIVAAIVLALGFTSSTSPSSSRRVSGLRPTAVLTVGGPSTSPAIPSGFLGFSTEYNAIESYVGSDPSSLNPVFLRLIRQLTPGQDPVIRVGGDSADRTWWPVAGMARPPGVSYTLDGTWLAVTRALTAALRAKLIVGINMEAGNLQLASTEADELVNGLGRSVVRALEIGDEPELYGAFPYYRVDGRGVKGRPRSYDLASFIREFAQFVAVMPEVPIAGPTVGGPGWLVDLNEFIADEPRVSLVTIHRYPLQLCFAKPTSTAYPTIARLLAPAASTGLADSFLPQLATARARGLPVRIDELGSVSCGADPSVSYTFASALWALQTMFEMARVGVDGVNVHTFPGAGYQLFQFSHSGGRWTGTVAPEYYGLLAFTQMAPPGSRLLSVGVSGAAPVHAWATRAPDGRVRVSLVDSDPGRAGVVALRIPGVHGRATVSRLRASGLAARSGVTLGGRSVGATGALDGSGRELTIEPTGGRYLVRVPATSAALVTFASS